jgi:maltodextrin utilization protein YvdJ
LTATTKTEEDSEMVETIKVKINGKEYNTARILKNGKNYIAISDLEQAGFNIGYDANTKTPSITNTSKELKILVDDKETSVEAVNINGSNYVPIRSLATATGTFEVGYENGKVTVKTK